MSVVFFLLVLSALVLIHEAGHFFTARLFKIKAEEFGYGFPPRLFGYVKVNGRWKRVGRKDHGPYQNTIWSFNWLPLGGFVRIKGEQADGENDPDSFHTRPAWQRLIVLAAGVIMNWLLAFSLFVAVFTIGTKAVVEDLPAGALVRDKSVRIVMVLPGAPADRAGFQPDDVVLAIAGETPKNYEDARNLITAQAEKEFLVRVRRDNQDMEFRVKSEYIKQVDRLALGVGLADVGHVSFPFWKSFQVAGLVTFGYTKAVVLTFADIFKDLFAGRPVAEEVSGPVGIAVMTGRVAQQGIVPLLQFAAILSVNLAVLNFLPIPALDGGRVLFLLIEKVRRRPMSRVLEAAIHNIAFLILVLLILLVTARDISRYGGVIAGGLKGLVGM